MTPLHAPDALAPDDLGPDSSNLRVSANAAFQSGIPPARDRLARSSDNEAALEQLEMVLVQSTRAEANLGLLLRGLKHLSAGAGAAQEANAALMLELELLRVRVGGVYESEHVLQRRVTALENTVEASVRERDSWLIQEDAFLAELLDDHEKKLLEQERLHDRRLAELDRTIEELRLQRDNSRIDVTRLTYERDAAVALLNEPVTNVPLTPSATPTSGVQRAVLGSVRLPKPVIKQKPDISSRPLVGYSVSDGEVADEQLAGAGGAATDHQGRAPADNATARAKTSSRPPRG
ncbi:MAG TPA: hypothetical protein VIW29_03675 [Polyangiaceae bacterium]